MLIPLEPGVIDELRWYFEQARTHPAPSHCDDVDDRFYNARDARFTALYRVWKRDRDGALTEVGSDAVHHPVTACSSRVETLDLGQRHSHLSPLVNVA